MKIIFLDVDGVLNGYNFWSMLGWRIAVKLNAKDWYRKYTREPFGVHEEKVRRLARIVKQTGAKIVMSSSWRDYFWNTPYEEKHKDQKKLADLFNKYDIEVIGITAHCASGRDTEILTWLSEHRTEISSFVIFDDENSFMEAFWNDDRFIQTSSVSKGKIIMGHWSENTGLKRKHVFRAVRVLNREE